MKTAFSQCVWVFGLICLCLVVTATHALAQQDATTPLDSAAEPDEKSSAETESGRLSIVNLDTYFLKDASGKPIPVIGFPYEEFLRLYNLDRKLTQPERRPQFSIQHVSISGSSTKERADLTVEVRVTTSAGKWVRVPLGLNDVVPTQTVQYEGSGEYFLHFDDTGGYVAWFKGSDSKQHVLKLNVLVTVDRVVDQHRIKLNLPLSTSSFFKLVVPGQRIQAAISEQAGQRGASLLSRKVTSEGDTELTAVGLPQDFSIRWHNRPTNPGSEATVIQAVGNVLVNIMGPGYIQSEARVRVHGFGGAIGSFRLKLPLGAKFVSSDQIGYEIALIGDEESEPNGSDDPGRQLLEVRFETESTSPLEIRIRTEFTQEIANRDHPVEVAGFEVVDAVRQTGHLALSVSGSTFPHWTGGPNIRRVNEGLPEFLHHEGIVAGFEYFRQQNGENSKLHVSLQPRKSRVHVEPTYIVLVESDQIRLQAIFEYTVRGAKADFLDIDLMGYERDSSESWVVDQVGPKSLVNEVSNLEDIGPLVVPLKQASTGKFQLIVEAHRDVTLSNGMVSFTLPRPVATTLHPATVAIVPDNHIEVVPRVDDIQGLVPEPVPPQLELPETQRTVLFYQDRGQATKSRFLGEVVLHSREISVGVANDVRVRPGSIGVLQRFSYDIAHVAIDRLELRLPIGLQDSGQLEITLNEHQLTTVPVNENLESRTILQEVSESVDENDSSSENVADENDGSLPTGKNDRDEMSVYVQLPTAKIGKFDLVARFSVPRDSMSRHRELQMEIPLILSKDGEVKSNRLTVQSSEALSVQVLEDSWIADFSDADRVGNRAIEQYSSNKAVSLLPITLTVTRSLESGSTVVDQAWYQTALTHQGRQDRATMRLTTTRKQLRFVLPKHANIRFAKCWLDGREVVVRPQPESTSTFAIDLNAQNGSESVLLEVWYPFLDRHLPRHQVSIQLPRLEDSNWTRQFFWQLILPRDEHLLVDPPGMSSANDWHWEWAWLRRVPNLTTFQLEKWVGAKSRQQLDDGKYVGLETANHYLFSSFGNPTRIDVRLAKRTTVLLIVSGGILLLGLAWMYMAIMQQPLVIVIACAVLIPAVMYAPELTSEAVFAIVIGLLLVVLAKVLRGMLGRRRRVMVRGGSSIVETGTSQIFKTTSDSAAPQTTVTAPLVVPLSSEDTSTELKS